MGQLNGSAVRSFHRKTIEYTYGRRFVECWQWLVCAFFLSVSAFLALSPAAVQAQDEAKAAEIPALKISIFVSNQANACLGPGNHSAVTRFATLAQERINAVGDIAGRRIQVDIFNDDETKPEATVKKIREIRADPNALAVVGMSSAKRARLALFNLKSQAGSGQSAVPLIADAALNLAAIKRPSTFSMVPSQSRVRDPIIAEFIAHEGFKRVSVISVDDGEHDKNIDNALRSKLTLDRFVSSHSLKTDDLVIKSVNGAENIPTALSDTVRQLSESKPDIIVVDVPTASTGDLIAQIYSSDWRPAIFLTGGLHDLPFGVVLIDNPGPIFALAWDKLPELYNGKLRNLVAQDRPDNWIFECGKGDQAVNDDPFHFRNLAAINLGTRYADMVSLIAAAARTASTRADVNALRESVADQLMTKFEPGKNAFKGIFRNWSFDPKTRSVARTPFIVIQPHTLGRGQLASSQFVRLHSGNLKRIETLYLDVDMIRLRGINDNEKTFFAEFYLAVRSPDGAKTRQIDRIEFTNAYLDPEVEDGRQITITTLHDGSESEAYPGNMQMYKVAGRFFFNPRLGNFPLDVQQFPIDLQPKSGNSPFIIQPPPLKYRDKNITSAGWKPKLQYVGYAADFVPVVDAFLHKPAIVPFYKSSFVWKMKRKTTDYFLRVVVPLAFILIVAYLSIFIPQSHLEAIVTIQITALLAAVALYLPLPQLETDTATISDRIFVFDYMMVSVMIVISILRINTRIQKMRWLDSLLSFLHITVIPGLVAYMAYWVYTASRLQI